MTNEELELWTQYKNTDDPKLKEELIVRYASFVKYVAGRVAMNLPSNVDFDDLVGYGIFGLIDAINKFDPKRNIKFKTYAQTRIRGAIFDELRLLDWTPRSVRQKARQLEKTYAELENKLGRSAEDEEVAEAMGMELTDLYKLFKDARGSLLLSLDKVCYDDENGSSRLDFVESGDADNPQFQMEKEEIKRVLAESIDKLSEREKLVITLYYYEELTLKEIGKILGVSDSRVSQLHTKAVLRLRSKLRNCKQDLLET